MAANNEKRPEKRKKNRARNKIIQKINKKYFRLRVKYLKYLLKKSIKGNTEWDDVFIKVTNEKIIVALMRIQEYAVEDIDYFTYKLKKIPVKKLNVEIKKIQKIIKEKNNGTRRFQKIKGKISETAQNVFRFFKFSHGSEKPK